MIFKVEKSIITACSHHDLPTCTIQFLTGGKTHWERHCLGGKKCRFLIEKQRRNMTTCALGRGRCSEPLMKGLFFRSYLNRCLLIIIVFQNVDLLHPRILFVSQSNNFSQEKELNSVQWWGEEMVGLGVYVLWVVCFRSAAEGTGETFLWTLGLLFFNTIFFALKGNGISLLSFLPLPHPLDIPLT